MNMIITSMLAGIVGTGLGGVLTVLLGYRTDKTIGGLLSFAGGVMTSIVFFELMPEAAAHAGMAISVVGLAAGVITVLWLNQFVDKISGPGRSPEALHDTFQEFFHEKKVIEGDSGSLRAGLLMLFVIGLHNIPEGLALGAAGYHDASLGVTLAVMIGVHNIPEGMAIAAPLLSGGLGRGKAVGLTLLAGAPTVLGALVGVLVGGVSDTALALAYSTAGGAMLYAVFGEILPQTIAISKDRAPTIILLAGVVFGMLLSRI